MPSNASGETAGDLPSQSEQGLIAKKRVNLFTILENDRFTLFAFKNNRLYKNFHRPSAIPPAVLE